MNRDAVPGVSINGHQASAVTAASSSTSAVPAF
jgi:hypothetical protein